MSSSNAARVYMMSMMLVLFILMSLSQPSGAGGEEGQGRLTTEANNKITSINKQRRGRANTMQEEDVEYDDNNESV